MNVLKDTMRQDHDLINGLDDDMNDVIDIGDDGRIATTDELDVGDVADDLQYDGYNFGLNKVEELLQEVCINRVECDLIGDVSSAKKQKVKYGKKKGVKNSRILKK